MLRRGINVAPQKQDNWPDACFRGAGVNKVKLFLDISMNFAVRPEGRGSKSDDAFDVMIVLGRWGLMGCADLALRLVLSSMPWLQIARRFIPFHPLLF